MAGLDGWLSRKYAIQQQQADSDTALRGAQTAETEARARTLDPLARASIASTQAGIGETQARTGLYGAQTAGVYDGLAPVGALGAQALYRSMQQWNRDPTGGAGPDPGPAGPYNPSGYPGPHVINMDPTPSITAGGVGGMNERSVTGNPDDPMNPYNPNNTRRSQFANGTAAVPPIRAPGQTITSGSWTGPTDPAPPISPLPPTVTLGTDLRRRLGMGAKAFAKGTSKVAHKGKGGHPHDAASAPPMPPMMPPGTPAGAPTPGMMGASMPGPMGPPQGAPGLASMLQAALGATRVPGAPQPAGTSKDVVPAMLTPNEAVVNKEGVKHIPGGRPAIAKANAKGLADRKQAQMRKGMGKSPGKAGNHVAVHIKMA